MRTINDYNKYTRFRKLGYKVIEYLMRNNEEIWKLLKYPTPDAWNKADLTLAEKRELIYNGQEDQSDYRVFRQSFLADGFSDEVSQLRIYPSEVIPDQRVWGTVPIAIEVLCHNKLTHLNNYENRLEVMFQNIMETLNGADIEGLGNLFFDLNGSGSTRARLNIYNNKDFLGYTIIMATRVG